MKTLNTLIMLFTAFLLTGCYEDDPFYYFDNVPPTPPSNVYIINGDNRVDIAWSHNHESDVAGYNVYYSYSYDGKYTLIGSTADDYFVDFGAGNGTRYYYGIAAYDYNGNESELSPDVAYATPRPEGYNQAIFNYRSFPENSGYSFTTYTPVPFDDLDCDFFFEIFEGAYYLNVWDDTDILDAGPTNDILDIPFAPTSGWNPKKYAAVIPGHTYIIWTWDNHYAKVRVSSVTRDRLVFDWAFQLVEGETQLKPLKTNTERTMTLVTGKKSMNDVQTIE